MPRLKNTPLALEVEQGKKYMWCGCGDSSIKPLCDKQGCTKGYCYQAIVSETVLFCGCGRTQEKPFCDGSHLTGLLEEFPKEK